MAAIDYFLKIEGIKGESTDQVFKDEIEVIAWSWGARQSEPPGASSRSSGKAQVNPLNLTTRTNLASAKLFIACASGQHFPSATLSAVRRSSRHSDAFLIWTLKDVMVIAYTVSAENLDVPPTDEISLEFSRIEMEYRPLNSDGTLGSIVKSGWDFHANRPV
jgi:type VI secretion system secreted protein Hcp